MLPLSALHDPQVPWLWLSSLSVHSLLPCVSHFLPFPYKDMSLDVGPPLNPVSPP